MITAAAHATRTVAFGDLRTGVWGAIWGGARPVAVIGSGDRSLSGPASVTGSDPDADWTISGDGVELTLAPEAGPVSINDAGFEQLCRATGEIVVGGHEQRVECLGRRGARAEEFDLARFESLRDVSAWFGAHEGLVVLALRPRGARGHDAELISVALIEPEPAIASDPRLSTTYASTGLPARASVELWLGDDESEQYPRRAAGEAVGAGASEWVDGLELQASLFHWYSRGRDGAGVYLLVRAR